MAVEYRTPYQAAVKELYANAFRCAYPSCQRPLYKVDAESGARSLNSNVAHICARREGGPRWDSDMTEHDNRSANNLLVLCLEHALEIDQTHRVSKFPVELLRKWKQEQVRDFDTLGRQGWMLTSEMADDVIRASESGTTITNSVLNLGGTGGSAPSAGGGGGGAFGANARGGVGGKGGDTRYEGVLINEHAFDYKLPSGEYPGAGGGGAGAEGENSVGGSGGGGGERFFASISLEEFEPFERPLRIEVKMGEGGAGARYPGELAENGGDTEVHIVTADGRIVRSILAKGGEKGLSGFALPPNAREVTSDDIILGLNVSALMVAEVINPKNGLLNVLGGAGEYWVYSALPAEVHWPTIVVFSLGQVPDSLLLTFYVVVEDPAGQEFFRLPFNVMKGAERLVANFIQPLAVQFLAETAGTWVMRVLSGKYEFARLPVEIRIDETQLVELG